MIINIIWPFLKQSYGLKTNDVGFNWTEDELIFQKMMIVMNTSFMNKLKLLSNTIARVPDGLKNRRNKYKKPIVYDKELEDKYYN